MNKQELADAVGATVATDGPFEGRVVVPLVAGLNADGTPIYESFPLAVALVYTHDELALGRLRGALVAKFDG